MPRALKPEPDLLKLYSLTAALKQSSGHDSEAKYNRKYQAVRLCGQWTYALRQGLDDVAQRDVLGQLGTDGAVAQLLRKGSTLLGVQLRHATLRPIRCRCHCVEGERPQLNVGQPSTPSLQAESKRVSVQRPSRAGWDAHFAACCPFNPAPNSNSSLVQESEDPHAGGAVAGAHLHLHGARPARKDAAAGCRRSCRYGLQPEMSHKESKPQSAKPKQPRTAPTSAWGGAPLLLGADLQRTGKPGKPMKQYTLPDKRPALCHRPSAHTCAVQLPRSMAATMTAGLCAALGKQLSLLLYGLIMY